MTNTPGNDNARRDAHREVRGGTAAGASGGNASGASGVDVRTASDDRTTKQSWIGTEDVRRGSNVSWGAIFGGVVTFFALMILLSLIPAALGFGGASGTAMGVWTVIALALSLAAAGYVAGALAGRSGLFHGFLTWATSVLGVLILVAWLGSTVLGALGGVVGSVVDTATSVAGQANVSGEQVAGAAQEAAQNVDPQQAQQVAQNAQQQAQQVAGQAADTAETGLWWTFAGNVIGAVLAALTGVAGARSVANKRNEYTSSRVN